MSIIKNIVITGASSGIGKALAVAYANKYLNNKINIFLFGRNIENLTQTAKECQLFGVNCFIYQRDVKNKDEMSLTLREIDKQYPIDLVIANAGISAGTSMGVESQLQVSNIFETNINGVINSIEPLIAKMIERKNGQIAIISSLAGFRGLPSSPAYSASKGAVRIYGEALRGNLAKFGIRVNVVCPGYTKTPMTAVNNFWMPFIMDSTKCAKKIINGLENNKARIAFPFLLYSVIWLLTIIPQSITDSIFSRLPAKKSFDE